MTNSIYTIRNYLPEDFDRYLQLISEAEETAPMGGRCALPEVLGERLDRPNYSPEHDLFLVETAGTIVGFSDVTPELKIGRVILNCYIQHKHRRNGLAARLFSYAICRARELGAGVAHVNIAGDNVTAVNVLSRLGFKFVRRFLLLRLDLTESHWQDVGRSALQYRPLQRGEEEKLTRIQNRSFAGTWGYNPNTVEDIAYYTNLTGCCPEDIILACSGDKIAGYCWTRMISETVYYEKKGQVFMLGVEPDCRREGTGREVLLAGLLHLKSKGLRFVELTVDSDNLAACSLYRSVGFDEQASSMWYEKAVD